MKILRKTLSKILLFFWIGILFAPFLVFVIFAPHDVYWNYVDKLEYYIEEMFK